jgi:hypothetical protein
MTRKVTGIAAPVSLEGFYFLAVILFVVGNVI